MTHVVSVFVSGMYMGEYTFSDLMNAAHFACGMEAASAHFGVVKSLRAVPDIHTDNENVDVNGIQQSEIDKAKAAAIALAGEL